MSLSFDDETYMSNLTSFDVKEEDVQNVVRLQVSLEDSLRWIMNVNFPCCLSDDISDIS